MVGSEKRIWLANICWWWCTSNKPECCFFQEKNMMESTSIMYWWLALLLLLLSAIDQQGDCQVVKPLTFVIKTSTRTPTSESGGGANLILDSGGDATATATEPTESKLLRKLRKCCKDGQRQAQVWNDCDEKLMDDPFRMRRMPKTCQKVYQVCCQQQIVDDHCKYGMMAILANRMATENPGFCGEKFNRNQWPLVESYRCCADCQQAIMIGQRLPKDGLNTGGHHHETCSWLATMIYAKNDSIFEQCCHQTTGSTTHRFELVDSSIIGGGSQHRSIKNAVDYFLEELDSKNKVDPLDYVVADDDDDDVIVVGDDADGGGGGGLMVARADDDGVDVAEHNHHCVNGFKFDPVENVCKDINECQLGTHQCHEALRCDNTVGSYHCVRVQDCGTGYTINADNYGCDDIDECQLNIDHCGPDYRCRNTQGSFKCDRVACPPDETLINGFCRHRRIACSSMDMIYDHGSGQCRPKRLDPCDSNPCRITEKCLQNGNDSYECAPLCRHGYRFDPTEQRCLDIDECQERTFRCGANQICQNLDGYYRCVCGSGYELNNHRQCVDINECLLNGPSAQCALESKMCVNTPGSYRCECGRGYYWNQTVQQCQDRDECSILEWNHCEQLCVNTMGSYVCQCRPGFRLMVNKHNCTDVDECSPSYYQSLSFGKPCRGLCVNTIGSYRCECPLGFRMDLKDPNHCVDVNECNPNEHNQINAMSSLTKRWYRMEPCMNPMDHCINLYGTFECVSIQCQDGYETKRTEQSIRCIWMDMRKRLRSLNDYHQYDYLYYNIYRDQTKFLESGNDSMNLYTVRMDAPIGGLYGSSFELRLKSAGLLEPPPDSRMFPDMRTTFDSLLMAPTLAERDHFELKLNSQGNEANVNVVRPLYGSQRIRLELICAGYRMGVFTRQLSTLTLMVSQYERF